MTKEEIKKYRVETLKMNQEELASEMKIDVGRIRNYEQGRIKAPGWYILLIQLITPNESGNPLFFRNKKFLQKIDKDIIENYSADGPKKIAGRFDESSDFVKNRAFLLRKKGVMK